MKILTVAIPNHHFFQWVNQLEGKGIAVYWFDITDSPGLSPKIPWVNQVKGWRRRWDFPFRSKLKKAAPKLYKTISKINERKAVSAFAKAYNKIRPDIIHCFEMQLAGLPILSFLKTITTPVIYSSWGSDLYDFKRLGMAEVEVNNFLDRADYLITDCHRDKGIAVKNGFKGVFLGVFPGNGGLKLPASKICALAQRNTILIKGYDDGVGQCSAVLNALEAIPNASLLPYNIIVYSADNNILDLVKTSKKLMNLNIFTHARSTFMPNNQLLSLMGKSSLHIASSISDGMPNALLEAMGMGAFPIQTNPGGATQEIINNGENGLLIEDATNHHEITQLICRALEDYDMRERAQTYNTQFVAEKYNRITLQDKIIKLYHSVYKARTI